MSLGQAIVIFCADKSPLDFKACAVRSGGTENVMDKLLGMVGLAVRAGKVRFGTYMTERAIADGSAKAVVVSADIGGDNRKKIEDKCAERRVPLVFCSTRAELSRSVGKRNIAALCICDENLAAAVLKIAGNC